MGKVTGFLEIDRQDRRYKPASDRIRHFKEFVIPLSEEATRDQAARCMNCGVPYCHTGCPVNNQIPDWNDLVYRGDWRDAHDAAHAPAAASGGIGISTAFISASARRYSTGITLRNLGRYSFQRSRIIAARADPV